MDKFGDEGMLRYEFGKNWSLFNAKEFSQERLEIAMESLLGLLGESGVQGKTVLDVGAGSGLFSLAALTLGASRVVSVDSDRDSIACCNGLKGSARAEASFKWEVVAGSVLDVEFIRSLGKFDVIYCWGVIHHTGAMWKAFENLCVALNQNGCLIVGIYNFRDGRFGSKTWRYLKKRYCESHFVVRGLWENLYWLWKAMRLVASGASPFKYARHYKQQRGMSWRRDISDWLGGYPYEAATPGEVLEFGRGKLGLELLKQETTPGLGINEFVFKKR